MTPMPLGVAVEKRLPTQRDRVATLVLSPYGDTDHGAVRGD